MEELDLRAAPRAASPKRHSPPRVAPECGERGARRSPRSQIRFERDGHAAWTWHMRGDQSPVTGCNSCRPADRTAHATGVYAHSFSGEWPCRVCGCGRLRSRAPLVDTSALGLAPEAQRNSSSSWHMGCMGGAEPETRERLHSISTAVKIHMEMDGRVVRCGVARARRGFSTYYLKYIRDIFFYEMYLIQAGPALV